MGRGGGTYYLSRARSNFTTIPIDRFRFPCSFQKLFKKEKEKKLKLLTRGLQSSSHISAATSSSSASSFLDFSGGQWSNVQCDDFMCSSPSSSNNIVESKKRRLTFEQVRSLETNFELDNKLEPERKMQLAMELGLQPRQVAVWFQNRRARWKTKQLERDYEVLSLDYSRLKAQFESIVQEKESLKTEVMVLQQLDHEEQSTSCTADQDSCSNSSEILNRDSQGTTTTKTTIHTSLNMLLPPPSQLVVMLTPDQGNSFSPGLHNIFTAPPAAAGFWPLDNNNNNNNRSIFI
ncbi:unnamed protein product [Sphagnum troendelagicum]|uniref:Homeobox domain-containing protein n=1 Tax=Sphagnum troendelagicum TaxID=128251 RepID=A0ABP0U4F4_9BRYO